MHHETYFYSAIHPDFFETFEKYQPTPELRTIVKELCLTDWAIVPAGFWTYCSPPGIVPQIQGWKVHISGTESSATELLRRIVPCLVSNRVPFKFCSDLNMLRLSTSKNWHRTGAGKFITAYPKDCEQFGCVAEQCYQQAHGMLGPHILTDKPYKDSRVVFYRYGAHLGMNRIDYMGRRIPMIVSPSGSLVSDQRVPFFRVPNWVIDPLSTVDSPASTNSEVGEVPLKNGRFRVTGVRKFSASGGIYIAEDKEKGGEVILREARPLIGNSVELLQKEARILQRLAGTGLAPRFVDLFQEWDHLFLAQERLYAESLWGYAMSFVIGRVQALSPQEVFERFRSTIRKIIDGMQIIHDKGIILRDFTKTNVLFTVSDPDPAAKFIDFELAYETDRDDPPVLGATFGYASPQQLLNDRPEPADDHYALGALILDMITFMAPGLVINRDGILKALRLTLTDLGLPRTMADAVEGLLESDRERRWKPQSVLEALDAPVFPNSKRELDPVMLTGVADPEIRRQPEDIETLRTTLEETVEGITKYILANVDYSRNDRLWPASPEVFFTSPISIRFGAAGIAYYLLRVTGSVPERVISWILAQSSPENCPSGLWVGLAGVAVFLLHAGFTDEAERLIESSKDWSRISEVPGLYEGVAGWGLANLHFWYFLRDRKYLNNAIDAADSLMRSAETDDMGMFWRADGKTPLGLAAGASGIALFLVYLYAAVQHEEFLTVSRRALDFDIANAAWLGDRVLHHEQKGVPASASKSPHMHHGSAGVGSAALRLHYVTMDERYKRFATSCAYTVSSRLTNKIWQDWGLSAFGELLLDSYTFLHREAYLDNAYYVAEALLPHRIFRPEGIAFTGSELLRISCDYGLGSAGIGVFLHRLLHPQLPRFLFLDEVLASHDVPGIPQIERARTMAEVDC